MTRWRMSDHELDRLLDEVRAALTDGPLTRYEIHERVPFLRQVPGTGWGVDVMGLAYLGELALAGGVTGSTKFRLIEPPAAIPHEEALRLLILRYFESYEPATLDDFRYWAGISAVHARQALLAARPGLQEVEVEGWPGVRYVRIGGTEHEGEIFGVCLLPKFDSLLMGYRDKSLFLPDRLKPLVFRKAGQVEATILKDGRVCGTWRLASAATAAKNRVLRRPTFSFELYRNLGKRDLARLEQAAHRLARRLRLGEPELVFRSL